MLPAPLTNALPKLAARIDDERPLISHALLDVIVTEIGDSIVRAEVQTEHSFEILSMPAQHEYLNNALSREWQKAAGFSITFKPLLKLAPTEEEPAPSSRNKRTANTLTFTERAALQNWMNQGTNAAFVATESDTDAAQKAICDLSDQGITITAGNIASMRKILGIEKIKPAKPAPLPVHDIDLVALHAAVQRHEQHFSAISITGESLAEVIAKMWSEIKDLKERITSLEASSD
jgi:hypothetical protein